jgi:hypothetical protein
MGAMSRPSCIRNAYHTLAVLAGLGLFFNASAQNPPAPTAEEGIALAIVYDTSGSMRDPVADTAGKMTPKHLIAKRALRAIIDRLAAHQSGPNAAAQNLEAGLVVFEQNRAFVAVPFRRFDAPTLRGWADRQKEPGGATPLGEATRTAADLVLGSRLTRKHVLVVTDGANTAGPDPATVIAQLKTLAARRQTGIGFHYVAFDVDAKLFDPIKKLGATVVSAADERQLNAQLEYIVERKILLEDEEPPAQGGNKNQ